MNVALTKELEDSFADAFNIELTKSAASEVDRAAKRTPVPLPSPVPAPDAATRLPRRIAGGFRGVSDELDRRATDWRNMVRLLEQQRPQLESAEADRERLYESLSRIVPVVQETGRALKDLVEATKAGDAGGDLAAQFTRNLNALDELESLAGAMGANLLLLRSIWEQYARSVVQAQKMREELKPGHGER